MRSSRARQVPGGGARLAVGLRALLGDGGEVEQVGRRLGHEADGRRAPPPAGRRPSTCTVPACRAAGRVQRPQQRRLARAVAAHQGDDLARGARRGRPRARRRRRRSARPARAPSSTAPGSARRVEPAAVPADQAAQAVAERRGLAAGVADRQRQRVPAGQPTEPHDRRGERARSASAAGRRRVRARRRRRRAARPWSAYCTTRSRRCSAITTVMPRSWTSRVTAASTSSAAVGSSAEVGSSSTRTRGWAVSTEPMATRCCWPPDSVRSGAVAQLGDAEQVERLLDPLAHHRRAARPAAPWRRPAPPRRCR